MAHASYGSGHSLHISAERVSDIGTQTSIHNCYGSVAMGVQAKTEAYIVVARQHISKSLSSVNCMEYY